MIINKLRSRQDEHLATPKQIRLLEKYGDNASFEISYGEYDVEYANGVKME